MSRSIFLILFVLCAIPVLAQPQLSTKSKKAIALYTEADNYRVRGQYDQAIAMLKEALDKDDEFVEAWYRLGLVYFSMHNLPEAIKHYEKGLSAHNRNTQAESILVRPGRSLPGHRRV